MTHDTSLAVLRKNPRFRPLIDKHGPPRLDRYHGKIDIFSSLVRSIIYQQVSGKAAAAIHGRFLALFPRKRATAQATLKLSSIQMRAAGLSAQKVSYMQDLAQKFTTGAVPYRRFAKMTSAEITAELIKIKGIGEWTVHMLLIFTLMRPDVLPTGDLAIRKGFQKIYRLKDMPNKKQMETLAKDWREHASVASWYLWRVMDENKIRTNTKSTKSEYRNPKQKAQNYKSKTTAFV